MRLRAILPSWTDQPVQTNGVPAMLESSTLVCNCELQSLCFPHECWALAYLLVALPLCGQNASPQTSPAEDKAFSAITELMAKTKQGGQNPSEQDYQARRDEGFETIGISLDDKKKDLL